MSIAVTFAALAFAAQARGPITLDATIQQVEQMVWDPTATSLAARHGLNVVNVTWEDTGRTKGSVWGPNISDMTIGVRDSGGYLHAMPVIRFDNYTDLTGDVPARNFILPVGNERGQELRPITLDRLLQHTRSLLHDPSSWKGGHWSLWDDRDDEVLVSAQACFLPVPREGEATFTPVIYNHQSTPGNPAVLTIVATREGTSIQVVENEGGYMSEPLFFNDDGQRAPFTAVRESDYRAGRAGDPGASTGPISGAGEDGMNVVLLVQVPLKQREVPRQWGAVAGEELEMTADMPMAEAKSAASDVENAVIGHGEAEGPFVEVNGLAIERDRRFPVRVTVQFYKATSNGVVTDRDIAEIRAGIDRVLSDASYVSSLVTESWTGRSTEWVEPPATAATTQWAWPSFGWLKTQ